MQFLEDLTRDVTRRVGVRLERLENFGSGNRFFAHTPRVVVRGRRDECIAMKKNN